MTACKEVSRIAWSSLALATASIAFLSSCGGPPGRAPERLRSEGKSLTEQKVQLSRFIPLRAEPSEIEYEGWFHDNSRGLVPGPSEWDVVGFIRVPPGQESAWTTGAGGARVPGPDQNPALEGVLAQLEASREDLQWSREGNALYGTAPGLVVFRVVAR